MSEYINLFDIPEIQEKVKTQESLKESLESKNRIIGDDCTPTSDRRPTTKEDIDNDIHIEDFDSAEELYNFLLNEIVCYEDEEEFCDVCDIDINSSLKDKILTIVRGFDDPSDGSTNFIYILLNGEEIWPCWYDTLEELNLKTCSEEDIKEVLKQEVEENDEETRKILRQAGINVDDFLPHLIPYDDEDDDFDVSNLSDFIFEVDTLEDWAKRADVELSPENFEAIAEAMQEETYESTGKEIDIDVFLKLIEEVWKAQ